MNQRDIFLRKWKDQQIAQAELDRKWRLQLEAQEQEQMMAEQAAYLASINPMNALHVGASGGNLGIVGNTLTLSVDSIESLSTTTWCINSSAATTFSVDWGDGDIEDYEGGDCIDHTYAEADTWTVVITFADPALITDIDFND